MGRFFILLIYNLLLPIFFIIAFPAWLIKMAKRGGIGTGLLERFSFYKGDAEFEKSGVVYIHAVSVGEVLIALKLINEWLQQHPNERILLVPTTATGHAVAKQQAPKNVRVIYSPLDFPIILKRVFKRFAPKQIILMESEIWPNMLDLARKKNIPVRIANGRLSHTSEKRYKQLSFLVKPLFNMIDHVCAQEPEDKPRWEGIGFPSNKVTVTGSIKFDQSGASAIVSKPEFEQMLDSLQGDVKRPVVMALSTHAGEEEWIAESLFPLRNDILLVIVPRHAERRDEVKNGVNKIGYRSILRSDFMIPSNTNDTCLIVDSTGELRNWTASADIAIVGKSILGKGGQNPTEAIAAKVPVITGEHMRNFEPLISRLRNSKSVVTVSTKDELNKAVTKVISDAVLRESLTTSALKVLQSHQGAATRTVDLLEM